jgi:hypothetical protein
MDQDPERQINYGSDQIWIQIVPKHFCGHLKKNIVKYLSSKSLNCIKNIGIFSDIQGASGIDARFLNQK